jgi:hypothetical protein
MMSRVSLDSHHQISSGAPTPDGASGATRERAGFPGTPDSPPATRAAGRTWKDPRLLVGIAIVAASVLLGARLLAAADDTVVVWSVRRDLPAGSAVGTTDLERVHLRFGTPELAARYLSASDPVPGGTVVARDIAAGELLPRSALGASDQADLAEVPIPVPSEAVPATLHSGEVVDVWVTPETANGDAPRAVRVLEQVRVVAVPSDGSALGPSATRQVLVGLPAGEQSGLATALAQLSAGRAVIVRRD